MRKLILPDRFKKKGRLAYYTLAHKTGAMVLVGFYLDNSKTQIRSLSTFSLNAFMRHLALIISA